MITDKGYLLLGAIVPLFLLGALFFCIAFGGIRRGEVQFRGHWLLRRHDGVMYWLVVCTAAVSGLAAMAAALWMATKIILNER